MVSSGVCEAELGEKLTGPMSHYSETAIGSCGNRSVLFCGECGAYFCDLHIGQKVGEPSINSPWLCIKCKKRKIQN